MDGRIVSTEFRSPPRPCARCAREDGVTTLTDLLMTREYNPEDIIHAFRDRPSKQSAQKDTVELDLHEEVERICETVRAASPPRKFRSTHPSLSTLIDSWRRMKAQLPQRQ